MGTSKRHATISQPCISATPFLVSAFLLSRHHCCSSLLSGCPRYLLNKLRKVQSNAAGCILRVPKHDHISPHLASLHWLPTHSRILASLCCNCLSSTAPVYLTELLEVYRPTRQLLSTEDTSILCFPAVCTRSLGQRSVSCAAPSVCNSLPFKVRSSKTLTVFRSSLKSHLFKLSC